MMVDVRYALPEKQVARGINTDQLSPVVRTTVMPLVNFKKKYSMSILQIQLKSFENNDNQGFFYDFRTGYDNLGIS